VDTGPQAGHPRVTCRRHARYLARYLRGGPIKNRRLLAFTGTAVCFRYRHYRGQQRPKWRTMTLPVDEFLDRLFQHIPVKGLHMVRAYALYNRSERAALERCRAQLDPHGLQALPTALPPVAEPAPCPRLWRAVDGDRLAHARSARVAISRTHGAGPAPPPPVQLTFGADAAAVLYGHLQ
jgi:hypothetical protein